MIQSILKMIYMSLIQSKFLYGLLLWGRHANNIVKLKKRAIQAVTMSPFFVHSEHSLKKLGILKIQDLYYTY